MKTFFDNYRLPEALLPLLSIHFLNNIYNMSYNFING